MTSPSRRKLQTTRRAASTPARTAARARRGAAGALALVFLALATAGTPAQEVPTPNWIPSSATPKVPLLDPSALPGASLPRPDAKMANPSGTWLPGPGPMASAPPAPLQGAEPKATVIVPTSLQQPMPPAGDAAIPRDYAQLDERTSNYRIYLDPPGPERLFRLESEASLQERIRQEGRQQKQVDKVVFPDEPVLSKAPYYGRDWPAQQEWAEPDYVCYKRLYFEQKNFERYGWDLGFITPFVSAGVFYADVVTLPYHAYTEPCRCHECSAGYCLPGDPVPLLLFPVELSLTGSLVEAGSVVAVLAIFP